MQYELENLNLAYRDRNIYTLEHLAHTTDCIFRPPCFLDLNWLTGSRDWCVNFIDVYYIDKRNLISNKQKNDDDDAVFGFLLLDKTQLLDVNGPLDKLILVRGDSYIAAKHGTKYVWPNMSHYTYNIHKDLIFDALRNLV